MSTLTLGITGIGGFIGLRLAERARARGWNVRGVDISQTAASRARDAGADVFIGDINDAQVLAQAFAGCDYVVHTAAVVEEDGARELFERINIEGTRSVCATARAQGVKRLVQISSIMVYGFDYPPNVAEAGPYADHGNIYNETKLRSERVALEFNTAEGAGIGVVAVRPGDVYGTHGAQWVLRPLEMLRRFQFGLPDGGRGVMNHVHVDNLVDGIFLAAERGIGGEAYNITDDVATRCRDFYAYHARMTRAWWIPTAPAFLLRGFLRLQVAIYRLFGARPPALPSAIDFLARRNKVSCEKAKTGLGYLPLVNLDQGMRRIGAELQQMGQKIYWP